MKKVIVLLIVAAVIVILLGIVSRLTMTPLVNIPARAFMGFAGVLLLLAIALEGLK